MMIQVKATEQYFVVVLLITVEPRFDEPLCNEVLGITNDIFQPSNSVMYGKEPRYNEPSIRRTNFPSPLALR